MRSEDPNEQKGTFNGKNLEPFMPFTTKNILKVKNFLLLSISKYCTLLIECTIKIMY